MHDVLRNEDFFAGREEMAPLTVSIFSLLKGGCAGMDFLPDDYSVHFIFKNGIACQVEHHRYAEFTRKGDFDSVQLAALETLEPKMLQVAQEFFLNYQKKWGWPNTCRISTGWLRHYAKASGEIIDLRTLEIAA